MVLPSGLHVRVLNYDSFEPYAEVKQGSNTYVVGQPGESFVVEVQGDADAFRTTPMIRATLKLDGRFLDYSMTLDEEYDFCVFEGYVVIDEQGEERNRPFVFAAPQTIPDETHTALPPTQAGQLSVSFTHVKSGSVPSRSIVPWKARKEVVPSLFVKFDEGKKWYEQSSLSVKPGELGETTTDYFTDYNRVVARMGTYTLKLETATTLLLRKILLDSDPAHADILRDNGLLQSPTQQHTHAVNRRLSYAGTGTSIQECIDLTNGATDNSAGAEASECINLT